MWCQRSKQRIQLRNSENYSLHRTCNASNRTMRTPSKESHSTCGPMHRPTTCLPRLHRVRICRRAVRRGNWSKSKQATNLCFAFRISSSVRPETAGAVEGRAGTEVMGGARMDTNTQRNNIKNLWRNARIYGKTNFIILGNLEVTTLKQTREQAPDKREIVRHSQLHTF
jgi:hypothetical protein